MHHWQSLCEPPEHMLTEATEHLSLWRRGRATKDNGSSGWFLESRELPRTHPWAIPDIVLRVHSPPHRAPTLIRYPWHIAVPSEIQRVEGIAKDIRAKSLTPNKGGIGINTQDSKQKQERKALEVKPLQIPNAELQQRPALCQAQN